MMDESLEAAAAKLQSSTCKAGRGVAGVGKEESKEEEEEDKE